MIATISKNSSVPVRSRAAEADRPIPPSLYENGPNEELTLDQFELLSIDRLKLLRHIEKLRTKGYEEKDMHQHIIEAEKNFLKSNSKNKNESVYGNLSNVERDINSHFILRLAYCRSEDLRRWFITYEILLFTARLHYLTDEERDTFMRRNGMSFEVASTQEKNEKESKLKGLSNVNDNNFYSTIFYKVPFLEALKLIGQRQVYLEKGMAYIPYSRLLNIIAVRFRQNLSQALTSASTFFDTVVSADPRIGPLLKNMSKQFLDNNDYNSKNSVHAADKLSSPEQIHASAPVHFPLCMRHLHQGLKKDNKLKHWGRLQYTLFLKGCGVDYDTALLFMQQHFSRIMSGDAFVKTYAYTFRHMFGKEGARRNYTPYSCAKIILGSPPESGAYHGCVYKHAPDSVLLSLLTQEKGLSQDTIREIILTAKNQHNNNAMNNNALGALGNTMHYQLACQRHFDATHPDHLTVLSQTDTRSEAVANHPNQWYQASVQYHRVKNEKAGIVSTTAAAAAAAATTNNANNTHNIDNSAVNNSTNNNPNNAATDEVMSEDA